MKSGDHTPYSNALALSLALHVVPGLLLAWSVSTYISPPRARTTSGVISFRISKPGSTPPIRPRRRPPSGTQSARLATQDENASENPSPSAPDTQKFEVQSVDTYARNLRLKIQVALQSGTSEPELPARGADLHLRLDEKGRVETLKVEVQGNPAPATDGEGVENWKAEITQAIHRAAPFGALPIGIPRLSLKIPIKPRRRNSF